VLTVFETWPQLAGGYLAVAIAQAVYVLFGFGAGLIAVGTMALFMPQVTDVVVMLMLISLPAEISVVARARRQIAWRGVWMVCLGLAVGVVVGTRILRFGEPRMLLTVLAAALIVASMAFLLMPSRRAVAWPGWSRPAVGLFSGVLAGLFGTGGPPLILYFRLSGANKAAFRGNLMAIFLLTTAVRLPAYALEGLITVPRLRSALVLLPAALLGGWLGHRVHLEISEVRFRQWVSVALCAIGILLLLR
jgi:uncharacterized membrane protein YfcA